MADDIHNFDLAESPDAAAIAPLMVAPAASPMGDLIAEIVSTHHVALRRDMPRLEALAGDLVYTDEAEPALIEIRQLVGGLCACVSQQLDREEQMLFPMLQRLEHQTVVTKCHAGMIRSRLVMADRDLARIRGVLHRMRDLAQEHLSPAGPCETCHEMLCVIDHILDDLREHTRKECAVLFPWAVARETALAR